MRVKKLVAKVWIFLRGLRAVADLCGRGGRMRRRGQFILILRGERAPKKRDFIFRSKFSKKNLNTLFLGFFQKFASGAENLVKLGSL